MGGKEHQAVMKSLSTLKGVASKDIYYASHP